MDEFEQGDLTPNQDEMLAQARADGAIADFATLDETERRDAETLKALGYFTPHLGKWDGERYVESTRHSLADNPAAVYLAGLTSVHSRRTMRGALNTLADLLQPNNVETTPYRCFGIAWHLLRFQHTSALRSALIERYCSPATGNKHLSALRGVLKAAWRLGLMSAEDYYTARDIKDVSGETIPAGRDLAQGEILALVQACKADTSPAGVRDAAIIGVLYTGGLRRSEVVKLDFADVESERGELTVMHGKGRKARRVPVATGARRALSAWLAIRGDESGALFCPVNKAGKVTIKPMTSQAVYNLLEKRAKVAGVKDFSPHDFRRTFVGDLLDRGVDIVTVQKLAGHASVNTTGRYDRRPEEAKRKAVEKLHYPF